MNWWNKLGYWRQYYLGLLPPLAIPLIGCFFMSEPVERHMSGVALVLFGSVWLDGFFRVAPSLDKERDK